MHAKTNSGTSILFNKTCTARQRLRLLRQRVLNLQDPAIYEVGIQRPPLDIPTNVVMFSRHARNRLPCHLPKANLDQIVLIMNLAGVGTVMLDRKVIRLRPGQALFIFPHQIHSYAELDMARMLWLYVSFKAERSEVLSQLRNAPVSISPTAWQHVRELIVGYAAHNHAGPARAAGIVVALWRLVNVLLSQASPARQPDGPAEVEEHVSHIQQYIIEHIREPFRIGAMARALAVSESKLCGDFRRFMQVSLGTYVRRWRVFYACRLIEASHDNISQIASQCGFTSVYAFSRTFKCVMSITPSEWRARNALEKSKGGGREKGTAARKTGRRYCR